MRATTRQIEGQRVESEREVTGQEAEELLRKYGYSDRQDTIRDNSVNKSDNLTFEEMLKEKEEKDKQKIHSVKPITFHSDNGYHSETKYGSDESTGLGFKIEVTSDMKLPK
jgi:hypothetical protein